ncbi:MAG: alpha/beta hydrolase [Thermoplasmata archaeon]|nr:alpha/beta hydrolase [Thermoplasmata archaeon]
MDNDLNNPGIDGTSTLSFMEAGNPGGSPIILVHGWGADHRYFEPQIDALAEHRLIIPDLEGFGSSPAPSEYSISLQAEKVYKLACSLGIKNAVVLGHSMGGMIAQEIALSYPDLVRGLILTDTSPGMKDFPFSRFIMALSPFLYLTTPGLRESLALRWAISYRNSKGAAGGMISEYARTACPRVLVRYVRAMRQWSSLSRLEKIRVPTLIIHGELDRAIPLKHSGTIKDRILISKLVIIPDSGHTPHLENPEAFNRVVKDFLERLTW